MGVEIELFHGVRGDYFGRIALASILSEAVRAHAGEAAGQGRVVMRLHGPEEEGPFPGPPRLVNLATRQGHCTVAVISDGSAIYHAEHPISGFLGPALRKLLSRLDPEETCWSFRLRVSADGGVGHREHGRPTPVVEGAIEVDLHRRKHRPFTVTPMAARSAEVVDPVRLGLPADGLRRINVLVSEATHAFLTVELPLSDRMEEGGFLLGKVTRADLPSEHHLVEITHVTPAERTGAGAVHFTFTGDSFLAAAKLIDDRGLGEELVGWYHTHLFGINVDMGLSDTDVNLHLATFQQPWQIAALINLTRRERWLRCYGRAGDELEEYPLWIADEHGRHHPARPDVGPG